MAEFQKVAKEKQRMCQKCLCSSCPLGEHNDKNGGCSKWAILYPEEAERIIMKWSAEHPIMTNAKKFEQVFGFSFYYRFGGSDVDTAWLAEEYKGGQDEQN